MQGESWTVYTSTLVKPKPFLRVLVRAVLSFWNLYIIVFNVYISARQENTGRKKYQCVIHNWDDFYGEE